MAGDNDRHGGANPALALFPGLYEAEAGYVLRSLRRLGVPDRDVEDMTHEVFVAAFRSLHTFEQDRPVRPWLFAIALRVAANFRRLARHGREVSAEKVDATDARPSPEGEVAAGEDRALILRALDALDLDQRAVFVMYELEEHAMADIATALSIPVNTAYSRLRLARAHFATAVRGLRPARAAAGGTP